MTTNEQDRAAMLEKIRLDMAQTRERLALMKEKKELSSTGDKRTDALALIEKLKRERELKSKSLSDTKSASFMDQAKLNSEIINKETPKQVPENLQVISNNINTNISNISNITSNEEKKIEISTPKIIEEKKEEVKVEIADTQIVVPKLSISSEKEEISQDNEIRTRQSSPSIDYTGEKKVVIVRKTADGKEVREVVQAIGEDGDRMITSEGKVIRVRKVTSSDANNNNNNANNLSANNNNLSSRISPNPMEGKKVPIGNSRLRKPSVDQGNTSVATNPKLQNMGTSKTSSPMGGAGKGIRSLEDLQKAIKKADRVKKQAQTQGKIEQLRRERDQTHMKLTREEKKAVRASKRLTVEMQHSESRVKVNDQINSFMRMMQTLEAEWQKGEEARIKREEELDSQRKMLETAGEQMSFLAKTMADVSAKIDHMKLLLDRIVDNTPKSAKKEDKWFEELKNFQELYWGMRHNLYVNTAKYNKLEKKTFEATAAVAESIGVPPPPPPINGLPPPMLSSSSGPSLNPVSNLLSQIRSGTSLKKLDPEEVKNEQSKRKGQWRQSVALLQGLQDTLRDALDQRHIALLDSDSDDDDDDDDDWDDDYE